MLDTNGREPIGHRARFASVEDGFNIQRPALEPRAFDAERDRALDPSTPSGAILLDMRYLDDALCSDHPLLLAKFLRIRAGEKIRVRLEPTPRFTMCCRGAGRASRPAVRCSAGMPATFFAWQVAPRRRIARMPATPCSTR